MLHVWCARGGGSPHPPHAAQPRSTNKTDRRKASAESLAKSEPSAGAPLSPARGDSGVGGGTSDYNSSSNQSTAQ